MELDPIERTSLMVAYWRACESRRPDALVRDRFALELSERLSPDERAQFSRSPLFAVTVDLLAVRTRLIDEWLAGAAGEGVRQFVSLGAGLDARPYRLDLGAGVRVFHVDTAAVNAYAARAFAAHAPARGTRLERVDADLHRPALLAGALRDHGFDRERPSAWLLEGLIEFIERRTLPLLLGALGAASAAGSRLLATVLDPGLVELARARCDTAFPWKRLDPLDAVLPLFTGWRLTVTSRDEMVQRFGRALPDVFHVVTGRREGDEPAAR